MADEEYDVDTVIRRPAFEKWEYKKIFTPSESYTSSSNRLSFYALAELSVECIQRRFADGLPPMDYEGTATLFLFRHYLELTLKKIVWGTRYLESNRKNASEESVIPVPNRHPLMDLWREASKNIPKKLGSGVWPQWDYGFVEQCIDEFDQVDPTSKRFRYGRIDHQIRTDPLTPVQVYWSALQYVMQHTRDVLEDMDTYLIETYGLNAEWKAEQNSW